MNLLFKKKKYLVGILLAVLAVCLLNFFQKEVRNFFYLFSSPIQKVLWRAGDRTSDFFESIIKTGGLKNEMEGLRNKNQELLAQNVALNNLKEENKILREALEIGLQKDFKIVLSQIISKDVSQDFILIDKGSEDGISKDMPVITQKKVLVGRIDEVYENFSKVMLISNKKSSFNAEILASDKGKQGESISGVVKGKGNSKILFDLIPREENLFQEDIIVTIVLGGIFPKGLLVGEVKEIKKVDVEPFQQAEITPFFNLSQAETLFIILEF